MAVCYIQFHTVCEYEEKLLCRENSTRKKNNKQIDATRHRAYECEHKWKVSFYRLYFIDASFHWKWIVLVLKWCARSSFHIQRYWFFFLGVCFTFSTPLYGECSIIFLCTHTVVLSPDVVYEKCHFHSVFIWYQCNGTVVWLLSLFTFYMSNSLWNQLSSISVSGFRHTYHRIFIQHTFIRLSCFASSIVWFSSHSRTFPKQSINNLEKNAHTTVWYGARFVWSTTSIPFNFFYGFFIFCASDTEYFCLFLHFR